MASAKPKSTARRNIKKAHDKKETHHRPSAEIHQDSFRRAGGKNGTQKPEGGLAPTDQEI